MSRKVAGRVVSEEALASRVVAYFTSLQHDVFQEVTYRGGATADLVAVQAVDGIRIAHVIECKTSASLSVLSQAHCWHGVAHRVSVAIPTPARAYDRERDFFKQVAERFGIGVYSVLSRDGSDDYGITQEVAPKFLRKVAGDTSILKHCHPAQRSFAAAGNCHGARWSPFKDTCEQMRVIIQRRGPTPLREVLAGVKHHYRTDASAVSSLYKWLKRGKVSGLVIDGKPAIVRLKEAV